MINNDIGQPDNPNAKRLLWAGFVAILAASVGFAVRGGIFANWSEIFGFTGAQLGAIGGAGFTGFCFGILIGGMVVDKIGYGRLVVAAFACHLISAFITFGATEGQSAETAYQFLYWGMFFFALANGILEAVANPLVATLFPENRNHYLNILHASWPLGLVIGGFIGWTLGSGDNALHWKWQLAFYLVPTVIYGLMFWGQKYPKSEASKKGLSFGEMFKDIGLLGGAVVCFMLYLFFRQTFEPIIGSQGAWIIAAIIGLGLLGAIGKLTSFAVGHVIIFVLFIAHALVGAVELGTDGWIQNITGSILSPEEGKMLFICTSLTMFFLRFCAHFIEKKLGLKPIGLLFTCSIIACFGLNLVSAVTSFGPALGALVVYATGKTFFWPTMLAIYGDRFPRTGAIAMSLSGGIGMMAAGLIGSPGLGYFQDRFAAETLETADTALYQEWKNEGSESSFLFFDKVEAIDPKRLEKAKKTEVDKRTPEEQTVVDAGIQGNRSTLKVDSFIPGTMALVYFILLLYFKSIGGYKPLKIEDE
ncbi:MAG: MFS transporter [Planctomycetes bacterium]|nr:MFS transporter [Planctomycetota bacterium]